MDCMICGWDISKEEQHTCVACGKVCCKSCFQPGGFSEQDRYDILRQINAPEELQEDIKLVLDTYDPRAQLCTDCLHSKFLTIYVGVIRYGSLTY
jgi:hypothetical protein